MTESTASGREPKEERLQRRTELARALARGGMDNVQIISLEEAHTVLTPKRRELIEALSQAGYESIRSLAREIDRDKGQVSRDLAILAEHGIVTFETDGRSKRPLLSQEHIVIEPIV